jgi:argininosuccinate lyase
VFENRSAGHDRHGTQRTAIASGLECGYLDATTFMEWLIRAAYLGRRITWLAGSCMSEQLGVPLAELPVEEFQAAHPELGERVYEVLGVKSAIASFVSYGSTAPEEVAKQVVRWKEKLAT